MVNCRTLTVATNNNLIAIKWQSVRVWKYIDESKAKLGTPREMFIIVLLNIALSTSANKMHPYIVGGQEVSIKHWPFITFIEISGHGLGMLSCGGSLVSSQTVLTAAHCLDDITGKKEATYGVEFTIYMGHSSYTKATLTRRALDYETHRKYDPEDDSVRYDIGILFLTRPVKFSDNVQKVVLQRSFSANRDKKFLVAGWGTTDPKGLSGVSKKLKAVELTTKSHMGCKNSYKIICTAVYNEYAYSGDSGGPLINADTRRLVGIVSFREMDSKISGFTSIPEYWDWIKETQLKLFKRFCGRRK